MMQQGDNERTGLRTHIDCFSGVGGVCTGFKAAGLKTVLAIEKVQSCIDTYTANHPEIPTLHMDIREVTAQDIRKVVTGDVDIVSSGMPCETFSTAGSSSRSFYDHRQFLFSEAIRIATIVNAKLILFENVPAITSKKTLKNGSHFIVDEISEQLSKSGYKYQVSAVLNAAEFGIPQVRKRYFLLAAKDSSINLKIPSPNGDNKTTVEMAIGDLPTVLANQTFTDPSYRTEPNDYVKILKDDEFWKLHGSGFVTYHLAPKHRPGTLERFRLIRQGEGLKDLFDKCSPEEIASLQKRRILPNRWFIQRNRRLLPLEPSFTVTSHCLDENIHPIQDRGLTVREVARLQSFPDSYDFKGGPLICPHKNEEQDKYEQIGDAVPPLLAYQWGLTIKDMLDK